MMRFCFAFVVCLTLLSSRATAQEVVVQPLGVRWLGQGSGDRTGYKNLPAPNGINDFVIVVDAASFISAAPVQWTIHADSPMRANLDWAWPQTAAQLSCIAIVPNGSEYELHFDPFLSVPGDIFRVTLGFADGAIQTGYVASEGVKWGENATWGGQTAEDRVGRTATPNGTRDWMIEVDDASFSPNDVREWTIWQDYSMSDPNFREYWTWRRGAPPENVDERPIAPVNSGTGTKLYFDPALGREGDQFVIQAVLESGEIVAWMLAGGGTDWGETAMYYGRIEQDQVGPLQASPNGINDIVMELLDPELSGGLKRFKVTSNGLKWEWPIGANTEADADSYYAKVEPKGGMLRVSLDNADETAGQFYFASAVLNDGRMLGWAVMTSRTNNSTEIAWLGQSADVISPYNWEAEQLSSQLFPPDGDLDLAVQVSHPLLGISEVKEWRVEGAGLAWGNPAGGVYSLHPVTGRPVVVSGFVTGATPYSPVAIKNAGAVAAAGGSSERIIYFAEPKEPIAKGSKFNVTAILADGNVIVWRIASPGSPTLTGLEWKGTERGKYVVSFDSPPGLLNSVRARTSIHTWNTSGEGGPADATLSGSGKVATLKLNADPATITPGARVTVEVTDGMGVRRYGTVFAGQVD